MDFRTNPEPDKREDDTHGIEAQAVERELDNVRLDGEYEQLAQDGRLCKRRVSVGGVTHEQQSCGFVLP